MTLQTNLDRWTRPNKAKLFKQERVNTLKFARLMEDIRIDVVRRSKNVKDLNEWLYELGLYTDVNVFVNGEKMTEAAAIIQSIAKTVDMVGMPPGSNPEIVKGVISESCMNYVTKLGEDMKIELKKTMIEAYNKQLAPADRANLMSERVKALSNSRAKVIARTETMRAANLTNLITARDIGAKSYIVKCDPRVCPKCLEFYGDGSIVFSIDDTEHYPPFHPNCRCTPRFSTKEPEEAFI